MPGRSALLSPWYHTTPLIGARPSGAIMALYKPDGPAPNSETPEVRRGEPGQGLLRAPRPRTSTRRTSCRSPRRGRPRGRGRPGGPRRSRTPTAEKSRADSGEAARQRISALASGAGLARRPTEHRRRLGELPRGVGGGRPAVALLERHLHVRLAGTEPDVADEHVADLGRGSRRPLADRTCGPPAGRGSRVAAHRPSGPAVAAARRGPNRTSTLAPGAAWPHTRMGRSRWTTMWSPNGAPSLTSRPGRRRRAPGPGRPP